MVAALAQEVTQLKESLASVTAAQANPNRKNVKENLCCRYEPPQRQHQQPTQYANILKPLRYLNTSNLKDNQWSVCLTFHVQGWSSWGSQNLGDSTVKSVKMLLFAFVRSTEGLMWNAKWRKTLSLIRPGGGLFSTAVKACYVNLRKSGPRWTCKPPGSLSHVTNQLTPSLLARTDVPVII